MRSQGHRLAGVRRETSNTLPSATLVNGDRQQAVQVIERTGKRWKGIRVLGLLLIVVAGFVLFAQWAQMIPEVWGLVSRLGWRASHAFRSVELAPGGTTGDLRSEVWRQTLTS